MSAEYNQDHEGNEATSMSLDWLYKKTQRFSVHALLTIGSEYALTLGREFLKAGITSAVKYGNPVAAFVGAIPDLIGLAISSQGVKHSPYEAEKAIFWGIKGAAIIAPFIVPQLVPALTIFSAVTTFIGMRKRK